MVVETDQYRYRWQEQGKNFVVLAVNDSVKFYRDGAWFVVLDVKNKKHRFSLVGAVRK